MKIFAVVCHPSQDSMTWSVFRAFEEGLESILPDVEVDVLDLHADDFQPHFTTNDHDAFNSRGDLDEDIQEYQARVDQADALVFITPIYWWSVPAMLKGWFDRVFTHGWAYDYDLENGGKVVGKLRDRTVFVLSLGATGQDGYERHGYDKAFKTQVEYGTLSYCGLTDIESHTFFSVMEPAYGGADPAGHLKKANALGQEMAKKLKDLGSDAISQSEKTVEVT